MVLIFLWEVDAWVGIIAEYQTEPMWLFTGFVRLIAVDELKQP